MMLHNGRGESLETVVPVTLHGLMSRWRRPCSTLRWLHNQGWCRRLGWRRWVAYGLARDEVGMLSGYAHATVGCCIAVFW